jgi:Flp pilus assembly pilin Flp
MKVIMNMLDHFILRPILPLSEMEDSISHLEGSKNFRICRFPSSEGGQAIVEYTLILAVIVLLILGALYQFNQGFQKFASGIMNGYTTCLLETGELPGDSAICADQFKQFNAADGKPLVKGVNDGSGGGGSGGGEDGKSGGKRGRQARGALDRNDSGSSAGRAEGAGGSVGTMKSASDYFNKKGRPKEQILGSTSDEKNYTGSTGSVRRPRLVGLLARPEESKTMKLDRKFILDKEEKKRGEPPKAVSAEGITDSTQSTKKLSYSVKRETASKAANDEGFSFGDWLRFLLIAAMIIAVVMLVLGQVAQISKSWEK